MKKTPYTFRFSRFLIIMLLIAATLTSTALADDGRHTDTVFATYDVLVEGPLSRGPNVPTELGTLPYTASFTNVQNGIYTSYYFTGVTSLRVEFWGTEPSAARFNVYVYSVSDQIMGQYASSVTMHTFYNLNASKNYAIFFKPSKGYSPADGHIDVYNGNP